MWFRRRENKTGEAAKALRDTRRHLRVIRAQAAEVEEVSNALKEIREQNHFAEAIEEILFGKGGVA